MKPTEKKRFSSLLRQLFRATSLSGPTHENVVETLVHLWSAQKAPSVDCADFHFSEELAASPSVKRFVDWLAQQEFLDGAYWLSSAYSVGTSREYRKQLAMFFTPPSITRRVLDDLESVGVDFASSSFLDPACGGAAFLAPIALRIKATLLAKRATPSEVIGHLERTVAGRDLDSFLCRLSKHFLRMVVAEEISATGIEPLFDVPVGDSLADTDTRACRADVVVCNPPYRKMKTPEVQALREKFGHVISAQPNLYGLFMTYCLEVLRPMGIAALVTPTSFMSGQYFSKIRSHLIGNSEILHIGIVGDRDGVFIDVEQETAITLLRARPQRDAADTTAEVSVVSRDGMLKSVGRCVLPNSGSVWPIPRADGDAQLIQMVGRSKYRFSDYGYNARIGIFVWNRDPRKTYFSLEEAALGKAVAPVPLLWSSDIRKTGDVFFPPAKKDNDEPSFVDMKELTNPSVVHKPSLLLQRVTSNDQPRRLIAATVPRQLIEGYGGFIGENHTVILEAKEEQPQYPPELLMVALSSPVVDRYFRCISGATNVSIFELSQLPLPSPKQLEIALEAGFSPDEAVMMAFQKST